MLIFAILITLTIVSVWKVSNSYINSGEWELWRILSIVFLIAATIILFTAHSGMNYDSERHKNMLARSTDVDYCSIQLLRMFCESNRDLCVAKSINDNLFLGVFVPDAYAEMRYINIQKIISICGCDGSDKRKCAIAKDYLLHIDCEVNNGLPENP